METKLVAIGNSQGVRLPKTVIDEAGVRLEQPLKVEVRRGSIVISPISGVRRGWEKAASSVEAQAEYLWAELPATLAGDDWTW